MIEEANIVICGLKDVKNMRFEKILKFLLGLFLFLLPWQTIWIFREVFVNGVKREYLTLGFYATEALLWIVIMMFIMWYWKNYKLQITNYKFKMTKDRVFVLAVLSLISYLLLSLIWSADKSLALQQSLHILEAFLLFFILLLGPLKKEEAIKWLVFGSILPCVLGIWQFLTQSTFASTWLGLASHPAWQGGTSVVASETIGRWLRAYGPFSHPNIFGGYLVIILFLLFFKERVPTDNSCQITNNKWRLFSFFICQLLLIAVFFTFSRSAWIVAMIIFVCLLFIDITHFKHHGSLFHGIASVKLLSVVCYLLFVFLFFPLVQTRLTGNSVSESYSITDRVSGYSDAWKLFKQNPILGVGAGNYTLYQTQPAHNAFVLFAVEGGVVGVGLLVMIIITYHLSRTTYQRDKIFWYVLCGTCYVTLASADHYLYSSYTGLMLSALFFGLILRRNNENTVSPQLVHCSSFDTPDTACHNTGTRQEPIVGAGA